MHIRRLHIKLTPILAFVLAVGFVLGAVPPQAANAFSGSDFRADRIIDDHLFFDPSTFGVHDIQAFLNSKVPSCDTWGTQMRGNVTRAEYSASRGVSAPFTCLKGYSQDIGGGMGADAYCGAIGGGIKTAAQMIKDVSDACSISPKVLIVLLQKEQSLIADDWPWPTQYDKATGYSCPDTAACNPEFAGFFRQIYYAARQYKRYASQPTSFSYRSGRSNFIRYNPNASCGGIDTFIQNQATAGLYNYTPYRPNQAALNNLFGSGDGCSAYGNRNFWRLYSEWFGSPTSGVCYNGVIGTVATDVTFRKVDSRVDVPDMQIYAGASTNCIESHVWNSGFTTWKGHIATGQPSVSYPESQVLYGDLEGDNRDYGILYGLRNTGSGMVEAHIFNRGSMSYYLAHTVSNLPAIDPADNKVIMADTNGDGKDESVLVKLRNTGSGKVELHGWGPGMKSWNFHSATNLPVITTPGDMDVTYGDLDGDGRDEAVAIAYQNTGSDRVEFHIWNPGEWSWKSHIVSNIPELDPQLGRISIVDIDGDGREEAVLTSKKNTSSGRVEFHVWQPDLTSWRGHFASNQITIQ